jgi:hypothetical protein
VTQKSFGKGGILEFSPKTFSECPLSILEISNPHWLSPEPEGRKGEYPNGEDRDHDQLNHPPF